jgi:hypothetical protein
MKRLVYVSAATVPFTDAALAQLLRISRDNNSRAGITGMLVYRDGDFLQILEGEDDALQETYLRIGRDTRHGRILLLDESRIDTREFADWSMGFRRMSREEMPDGFVDFFGRQFDPESVAQRGGEAIAFLRSFRAIA